MADLDYSSNPNQRTPCVLVLDASTSMETTGPSGQTRIDALNEGLKTLEKHLRGDDTAITRVQLAIVSVGGPNNSAQIMMDWTDAENFQAFDLVTGGMTPLGRGIQIGLDLVEDCKQELRESGISYTRPWMIIMSDGMPTDGDVIWNQVVTECRDAEDEQKVEFFPIGVEGASTDTLDEISSKGSLKLDGIKFNELFVWLSSSLSAVSQSRPGEELKLPSMDPWRNVKV